MYSSDSGEEELKIQTQNSNANLSDVQETIEQEEGYEIAITNLDENFLQTIKEVSKEFDPKAIIKTILNEN